MPTSVDEFISGKLPVTVVKLDDSLMDAAKKMIQHDYSQLPVVDGSGRPVGAITSDSILKALVNYKTALHSLRIKHVMEKNPRLFRQDIDLLDLFDDMDGTYVFVVNEAGDLVQIVTAADTTDYFRQRANDILLVENIENTIKDYVQLAFDSAADGEEKLQQAIQSMTNSSLAQRDKFVKGIRNYLKENDNWDAFDKERAEKYANKYFKDGREPKGFDDLDLAHYISLFLYRGNWTQLESIFELPREAFENLLNSVRLTRNDLSHFREITRDQSYQLRACYDLLVSHQEDFHHIYAQASAVVEDLTAEAETSEMDGVRNPVADEPAQGESRYAPLAIWLQEQASEKSLLTPSYAAIEEIIGGKLPDSAYKNRTWWANYAGYSHARQWLDVGWRVASVNMSGQVVRFARIKERQKAYIDFYGELIKDLRHQPGFENLHPSPDGGNWIYLRTISVYGSVLASLNFSFGRGGVFRSELYIDYGDQDVNKRVFDALQANQQEIEEAFGVELAWQRLDNKRASRIAHILRGHIADDPNELEALRKKAVPAMVRLAQVLEPRVISVGEQVLK